jgi:hypothetical protein
VRHGGVTLFELVGLAPRSWAALAPDATRSLEQVLVSSSLLEVTGEGAEPGLLLVQEEGMLQRPSLLLELSTADILRYWALLTVDQRAAFIEARARIAGDDDPLVARLAPLPVETTMFDRFAGVFHAFECLHERVRAALEGASLREADYRLFGRKYDSVGTLLDRLLTDARAGRGDPIEQYVAVLCTRQLLSGLARAFPRYWSERQADVSRLASLLEDAASLRARLVAGDPEMPAFIEWFERWFLQRAVPVSEDQPS